MEKSSAELAVEAQVTFRKENPAGVASGAVMGGPDRPLTLGERRVVLTFNPSSDKRVDDMKRRCAVLIDEMAELQNAELQNAGRGEKLDEARWCSVAMAHFEDACMYAVKAIAART